MQHQKELCLMPRTSVNQTVKLANWRELNVMHLKGVILRVFFTEAIAYQCTDFTSNTAPFVPVAA